MNFCGGPVDEQVLVVPGERLGRRRVDDHLNRDMKQSLHPETVDDSLASGQDMIPSHLLKGDSHSIVSVIPTTSLVQGITTSKNTDRNRKNLRVQVNASMVGQSSGTYSYSAAKNKGLQHPIEVATTVASSSSPLSPLRENNPNVLSPLGEILDTLSGGFSVRLIGGPSSIYSGHETFLLYLHEDQDRLCLQASSCNEEKKYDVLDFGFELPLHKVLRVEVSKSYASKPLHNFSLILRKDSYEQPTVGAIEYVDFEAASAVEREVIVSTIMILLDHIVNTSVSGSTENGGTLDRPIPCSPSLDEDKYQLSPSKRTQIYADDEGTETSLVIHLEHLASPRAGQQEMQGLQWRPDHTRSVKREVDERKIMDGFRSDARSQAFNSQKHPLKGKPQEYHTSEPQEFIPMEPRINYDKQSTGQDDMQPHVDLEPPTPGIHGQYRNSTIPRTFKRRTEWAQTNNIARGIRERPRDIYDDDREKISSEDFTIVKTESKEDLSNDGGDGASSPPHESLMKKSRSSQLAPGAWCSDDVCTLALKDIAETCSGIFALKDQDGTCTSTSMGGDQQAAIEEYLASALGAPTAVYSYIMKGDAWNSEQVSSPRNLNRRLQNRSGTLHGQAARIRTLRNEMTFAAALRQSRERMKFIRTTQSLDDSCPDRVPEMNEIPMSDLSCRFQSSSLLKQVVDTMFKDMDDMHIHNKNDIEYYDSDPEDIRPRAMRTLGSRRVVAERENQLAHTRIRHRRVLSGSGLERMTTKKVRKLDEEAVIEMVQTMYNERLILMWHPTQTQDEPNRSPVCVKVWIESGVYLMDGSFLLPKLTWAKAYERTTGKPRAGNALQKLDLLDVCRIRPAQSIDRGLHPFACSSRSFSIDTQSEAFLFEAQSRKERDRIVYGLKLVVARLASLLMLRDVRAADEFFGAMAAGWVPGENPLWSNANVNTADLQNEHQQESSMTSSESVNDTKDESR